jgi:hypothetical protein
MWNHINQYPESYTLFQKLEILGLKDQKKITLLLVFSKQKLSTQKSVFPTPDTFSHSVLISEPC